MTHLLFHDEEEAMDKINIDTLFEKNHKKDLKQFRRREEYHVYGR